MRSLLRKAAAISASASLVFFWSCERHEVGELPNHPQHGKPGEKHHGKGDHAHKPGEKKDGDAHSHATKSEDDHDHSHADDKPNAADGGAHQHGTGTPPPGHDGHAPPSPAASPAGTPAQFFPTSTPR